MKDYYVNFWGGEGYLASACLLATASVGMLNGLEDSSIADGEKKVKINYHCLDYSSGGKDFERQKTIYDGYNKYFRELFSLDSNYDLNIFYTKKVISDISGVDANNRCLSMKYNQNDPTKSEDKYLAFGCSSSEMNKDIRKGIYGLPWVGEIYHSTADFQNLYTNLGTDTKIVNCGGYKGGGTAATFIPLENMSELPGKRYNVIAGPSTEFDHSVTLEADIYRGNPVKGVENGKVDLFDADAVAKDLENGPYAKGVNEAENRKNVEKLRSEYRKKIFNPDENLDHTSLNPKYYMSRYIDRIASDSQMDNIEFSIINLRPDLEQTDGRYNYDQTCDIFQPDEQSHKLHITNLMNAVAIADIFSGMGEKNAIYSFSSSPDQRFNAVNLFGENNAKKVIVFTGTCVVLSYFVYGFTCDIQNGLKTQGSDMNKRWMETTLTGKLILDESDKGKLNTGNASAISGCLLNVIKDFMLPVLNVFDDVNKTSETVSLFSADINTLISKLVESDENGENYKLPERIKSFKNGSDLVNELKNNMRILNDRATDRHLENYIDDYTKHFEKYKSPKDVDKEKVSEYVGKIIGYTYRTVEKFMDIH